MRFALCLLIVIVVVFAEVPEHNPDLDSNCPKGFQWSKGTISCKQADCPEGAGRTYTYDCSCGEAWDKPFRTCYDPNQPGYAITCVAAGAKCPGEEAPTPQCNFDRDCKHGEKCNSETGKCETVSGCVVDSDCPIDYTCNNNECKATTECNSDSDCLAGKKCNIGTYICEDKSEKECNDISCFLNGGKCISDICVVENMCKDLECPNKCEYGISKSGGTCDGNGGVCKYSTQMDCTNGCSDSGKRCRIAVGKITLVDIDNSTKPIKNVRVEAEWYDELGNLKEGLNSRYSDDEGKVYFSNEELDKYENGTFRVTVVFEDKDKSVQIVDGSGLGAAPTDDQRLAAPLANYTTDLVIEDFTNDFDVNLTLNHDVTEAKYGRVYYHATEATAFMKELGVTQKKTERFYLDDPNTNGAYHNAGGEIGALDKGIVYSARVSSFTNSESPTNREWHEFGHHIMYERYGFHLCCSAKYGLNHEGYKNGISIDSYTEGFAEFMSMMMLDHYKYPKKNLYFVGATPFDMEINYRVSSNVGGVTMEEMSLASIYYDLLDGGSGDEDGIELSKSQIWGVIGSKNTLDGQSRYIYNIWDAYRAFNQTDLPGLHEEWGNNQLVSKLDRVFISHGVYADKNGDELWEPGEAVGYTIKDGVARADGETTKQFNRDLIPGSYIKLDITDEVTGWEIDYYPIHVKEHVSGIEEGEAVEYDFEFDTVPENGMININMPPEEYQTTMVFSFGDDENYERKDGFEITSKEFYDTLNPGNPVFKTYSGTLKAKPKPVSKPVSIDDSVQLICPCIPTFVLVLLGALVSRKR